MTVARRQQAIISAVSKMAFLAEGKGNVMGCDTQLA